MSVVTVSPKYQVVLPKEVRERLQLVPGCKLMVFASPSGVRLVPVTPIERSRGFFPGLSTEPDRAQDRDLGSEARVP